MRNNRPLRRPIAVGHTIYAFKEGGMERGLLNIVNYGDREHFSHFILCLTEAGDFARRIVSPKCEIIELHKREGNDLWVIWRIADAARRLKLDILHARGWPTLVETALAARICPVRSTIYSFHGRTLSDLQSPSLRRKLAQNIFIRSYTQVVTLNCRMQSELAAETGLPTNRIVVVPNGVDVNLFRPYDDRRALRASFGLPLDRFIVGNVARLDPVKNHEVILRAVHRLRVERCAPLVLLIGDGEHRTFLEREIQRLGLEKDVSLFGFSDRIPELLNCMDLYIQSSFYEGFSNTVLEAMACGLPVLATDVGGTADLFSTGQEGFYFNPEDDATLAALITTLTKNTALRHIMGIQARCRAVGCFSVQSMVQDYEVMYQALAPANHD